MVGTRKLKYWIESILIAESNQNAMDLQTKYEKADLNRA